MVPGLAFGLFLFFGSYQVWAQTTPLAPREPNPTQDARPAQTDGDGTSGHAGKAAQQAGEKASDDIKAKEAQPPEVKPPMPTWAGAVSFGLAGLMLAAAFWNLHLLLGRLKVEPMYISVRRCGLSRTHMRFECSASVIYLFLFVAFLAGSISVTLSTTSVQAQQQTKIDVESKK